MKSILRIIDMRLLLAVLLIIPSQNILGDNYNQSLYSAP